MKLERMVRSVREPAQISVLKKAGFAAGSLLLGTGMGIAAKAADNVSVIGDIGTCLGVWVFSAALIAVVSPSPLGAALNTFLFFTGMLVSYFAYTKLVLGFFPSGYAAGWTAVSAVTPAAGFVAWFGRGRGWAGTVCASLPVSVLFAEGYPFFYTQKPELAFALACGLILTALVPRTPVQKLRALALAAVLAFIAAKLDILSLLPW